MSERNEKWSIFQAKIVRVKSLLFAATLVSEEALVSNEKDNYLPKFSPDGKKLAFIEDRRTLKYVNL